MFAGPTGKHSAAPGRLPGERTLGVCAGSAGARGEDSSGEQGGGASGGHVLSPPARPSAAPHAHGLLARSG